MAGPLIFVVAIMGCGDAGGACTPARTLPAHYATLSACRAALPARLAENTDVSWPEIAADCRPADARVAKVDGPKRG